MGFLTKVQAKEDTLTISLEDIYANDPDFNNFIEKATALIRAFSVKFMVDNHKLADIFFKIVKKEL